MIELLKLLFGICFLVLGIPVGNFLASQTKEELKDGKKYFILLVWVGLAGGAVGLVLGNDALLFTMFFIAIVTSRSLKKKVKRKIKKIPKIYPK